MDNRSFRLEPEDPLDCSVPECDAVEEEDSGLCAYHLDMERGYSYDWPDFHDEQDYNYYEGLGHLNDSYKY